MRLQRIVAIIFLLLQKEKITAKDLAERFEVSIRTIYRDIDCISAAGIPVMAFSGTGGGICIMKEYKLEKGFFSSADLASILMGLGFLSDSLFDEQLKFTLEKIYAFIPKTQQQSVMQEAGMVSLDMKAWKGHATSQDLIKKLHLALKNRQTITFDYCKANGLVSKRIVEPHHLAFKEQHWYLIGYCLSQASFRNFKCSRISNLHVNSCQFKQRKVPPLIEKFTQTMAEKIIRIKLRIHASILDEVLQYCSKDCIVKEDEEYYLVDFRFIDDHYGYSILMSFGEHCECLEPASIRQELIHKLKNTLFLYTGH